MGNDDLADELKYGIAVGALLASLLYWLLERLRSDDSAKSPDEMDTEELLVSIEVELDIIREYAQELANRAGPQTASPSSTLRQELNDEFADLDIDVSSVQEALEIDFVDSDADTESIQEELDDFEAGRLGDEDLSLDDEGNEGEEFGNDEEDSPD